MEITLAKPRGFCAGVDRAIDIVERTLELYGAPIYVRHEVVHNSYVVSDLKSKGAVFVEDLNEIPDKSTVIFSAHGVSQAVRKQANNRSLKVFDATCPLVTKVHLEVTRHSLAGEEVVLIGHKGHPEVEGTLGQYEMQHGGGIYLVESVENVNTLEVKNPETLAYVTQTTLSVDDAREIIKALKEKFPCISGPRKDDICYATQNRQDAVKNLAVECDVMLVVGSTNSSNSNRLKELAEKQGIPAYLIDGADDLRKKWFTRVARIGLTAGASAPDILVEEVAEKLSNWFDCDYRESSGARENVVFSLPKELRL